MSAIQGDVVPNDSQPRNAPEQDEDSVRAVVFHDDYELSILLEADGRLRCVLHACGVEGVERFVPGSATVVSNARHGEGGEQRANEWSERLELLQRTLKPIHYRTTPPGAAPGQPATVECIATPIPAADGTLDSILLQAYDRSSTERVQVQLHESEARFRLLTEAVPQMIWFANAAREVIYFAPQWETFTGRPAAELVNGGLMALVHPSDLTSLQASREVASEFKSVAFRLRRHDGVYRWLEAEYRALYDDDGAITAWIGATSDITDRRAADLHVREQREQLRAALSLTGIGRLTVDLRTNTARGDQRASEIFGVDLDRADRDRTVFAALVLPDDLAAVRAALERATAAPSDLDTESDFDAEYRIRRPTGEDGTTDLRWIVARGRIEFEGQTPIRMVLVIEDVTQRKLEEDARLRWQKREAIGTLAGGIAHDFNNVISAILSNASLADAEIKGGFSPATSIFEITRAAERAADVVKRLLTFSREDDAESTPFDLSAVAHEVCSLMTRTLPHDVTVVCSAPDGLAPAIGSSGEIHQVVMNLVANAAHAVGDRAGTIEVEVDEVAGGSRNDGGPAAASLRLRVTDSGSGIPDSVIDHIFDPFFTTRPVGEGTGLGLASAHTIIARHGGSITAANIDGGGARFEVVLPTVARTAAPLEPARAAPRRDDAAAAPPRGRQVFFVDDEPALVRLAERALPLHGYRVGAFTDPAEALAAFRVDPIAVDAVITDLSMPGMSGLDLIRAARSVSPDLPAVLTSGLLRPEDRAEADDLGVDVIVPKPCTIDQLVDAVEGVLGREPAAGDR